MSEKGGGDAARKRLGAVLDRLGQAALRIESERKQAGQARAELQAALDALKQERDRLVREGKERVARLEAEKQTLAAEKAELAARVERLGDELSTLSESGGGALIAGIREDRDRLREELLRTRGERDELAVAYRTLKRRFVDGNRQRDELTETLDSILDDCEKLLATG